MQKQSLEGLKGRQGRLKRMIDEQLSMTTIRPAAAGVLLIGAATIGFWYLTRDGSSASMLVFLAGVALVSLAVLLYFLSPARQLQAEVSDGVALANTTNVGRLLAGMLIDARGIHLPASETRPMKVFIPASEEEHVPLDSIKAGSVFVLPKAGARGILLDPPGLGLFSRAKQIGVIFTETGLEAELRDVLEKGMELAGRAQVKREGDQVQVTLWDLANKGLCRAIRKEQPKICTQTCCPVCSFLACAIAEATGEAVRVKEIEAGGGKVHATFELFREADPAWTSV